GLIGRHNLSRVAVSLDTLDETVQDAFRGHGAWQDAMDTIRLLRDRGILFDINVTGVRPVLEGIGALIQFADEAGCRRVNVHWPSSIGLGADLAADHIPGRDQWQDLILMVTKRVETLPHFFLENERGVLGEGDPPARRAPADVCNLQILPDP